MDIEQYFTAFKRSIQQNPNVQFVQTPILLQKFSQFQGRIKARLYFWDGSQLNVEEVVTTQNGYPERVGYSYAYLHDEVNVFRYDNAPHFPQFATFPHHKHVGADETAEPAEQPTLKQIFREIDEYISNL
ncbi:MAG: hypothetical protein H6668_03935 [Ardenticatenaceae bacterium]|nr:hypothetical protein [Ardenticatenaceae bacterium]